ncbi:MAG: sigma-70 family RNA polymerase sigma factor [Verrucomicrobiota bacterium]
MLETSENFPKVAIASAVDTGNPARPLTREKFVGQAMLDYESPLIGYAATILNDPDLARDVVQDTFVRLCQQDPNKVRTNLKAWLFTVCRNRALDLLRKEKRSQPLEEIRWKKIAGAELPPDEQADQQERLSQLAVYLNRLTVNQREVIILKFQQGLSYQDIHEITGLATGNIGFLIHTGLKRLREILPSDLRF